MLFGHMGLYAGPVQWDALKGDCCCVCGSELTKAGSLTANTHLWAPTCLE